jgi:predicted MFS family arabinose efflux permease
MFDQFLVNVSEGKLSLEKLAHSASIDIGPVTDNRPFFYKFERGLPKPFGTFAFLIAAGLGLLAVLVLRRSTRNNDPSSFSAALIQWPGLKLFLLLFSVLGGGYMLVEIAFFQKLMLFIGQPQMALTVLLFSLLLGGGLGSLLSSLIRKRTGRTVAFLSLGTAVLVALFSLFFQRFFELGLGPRATAVAILFPLGFLMGFPFPLAIRQVAALGMGAQIPVMWGVNGVASVLGSALAMIVGMLVGFSWALLLGALLYVLAAVLFLLLGAKAVA